MPRRPPPRVSYLLARPSMALSCLSHPPPRPLALWGGGVDALTRKRAHSEWKGVPPPAICDGGAKSVALEEGQRFTAAATEAGSLIRPPFNDATLPKEGRRYRPPRGTGCNASPPAAIPALPTYQVAR